MWINAFLMESENASQCQRDEAKPPCRARFVVKSIRSRQIRGDFVPKIKELTKNKRRDAKEVAYLFIRGDE